MADFAEDMADFAEDMADFAEDMADFAEDMADFCWGYGGLFFPNFTTILSEIR